MLNSLDWNHSFKMFCEFCKCQYRSSSFYHSLNEHSHLLPLLRFQAILTRFITPQSRGRVTGSGSTGWWGEPFAQLIPGS